jgi:hypothetical protein
MKVLFPVLPKGVCGVASSLGVDKPRQRGQPVFVLRDSGLLLSAFEASGSGECVVWWLRVFGGPWRGGYTLVNRFDVECLDE